MAAASEKARGLGRRTLQFSENRADSVDEHLAAGMRQVFRVPDWSVGARPIDMQVGRVKQHHVT